MVKTLYAKLSVILLLVFITLGTILLLVIEKSATGLQDETAQKLHLELAQHIIDDLKPWQDSGLNLQAVKEAFHVMMILGPSIELYIVDPDGNIIAYDAPEEKIRIPKIDLNPIKTFIAGHADFPILGDDPRSSKRKKIFSAAPIMQQQQLQGYLYIIIGGEQYDSIASVLQTNHILRIGVGIILATACFLLVVVLLLFYNMTRPIRQLAQDMHAFEASEFRQPPAFDLQAKSNTGEIKALQHSFFELTKKIMSQIDRLELVDQQRREFFAQISHDLRTPLAGLQGYLETLHLKGKALEDSQREQFIDIAIQQTHRLSKLIDNLFQLARLESNEVKLSKEAFNLCELINDIIQQTQVLAEGKSITVKFATDNDMINVIADIGKIERVIVNLLENAIHYTPAQGKITVELRSDFAANTVTVNINDTGIGIATEDMPHIFDPYFRAKHTANKYQQGSGLGLAISQRLLQLHDSELMISSKVDEGTCASFTLPIK